MADEGDPRGGVLVITVHLDQQGPGDFLAVLRADPGGDEPTVLRHATREGVLAAVADWLDGVKR